MADLTAVSAGSGVAFLVAAGMSAEITAKACSSPQTTELNAHSRASTLMKWVNIGMVEGLLFIAIAAWLEPKTRTAILAGGLLATAITYGEYLYAKRSGLASDAPGTENY